MPPVRRTVPTPRRRLPLLMVRRSRNLDPAIGVTSPFRMTGNIAMNEGFSWPRAAAALALAAGVCLAGAYPLCAGDANLPKLKTNQQYLEDLARKTDLKAGDPLAVLDYVLHSLPDRVKVYPTENYYYFSFTASGVAYEGNIRIDASDRDQGFVNFGYVEQPALWRPNQETTYRHLGAADGVKLEKLAALSYKLTYKDRSVVFDLNDLSNVNPPEGMLSANEVYIGPSFDESGLSFFLVFNKDLKLFHYIYNEKSSFPEQFDSAEFSPQMSIGRRTGFVLYKDKQKDRNILIGANDGNSYLNNYNDGPFDQLPDNFIQGEALRDAILAVLPEYKDKIDRFGGLPDGSERYAITPYFYYKTADELKIVEDCVNDQKRPAADYYGCFDSERYNAGKDDGGEAAQGDNAAQPQLDKKP
jgi:hypothetical protein